MLTIYSVNVNIKMYCYNEELDSKIKKYDFHKEYLSKISEILQNIVNNKSFKEFKEGEMGIKSDFINASTIKAFHDVLYDTNFFFDKYQSVTIGLLMLAHKYCIEPLYIICQTGIEEFILNKNNHEIIRRKGFMINSDDHIIEVLKVAHLLNDNRLFECGAIFVHGNFEKLDKTQEWKNFMDENSDDGSFMRKFMTFIMHNSAPYKNRYFSE